MWQINFEDYSCGHSDEVAFSYCIIVIQMRDTLTHCKPVDKQCMHHGACVHMKVKDQPFPICCHCNHHTSSSPTSRFRKGGSASLARYFASSCKHMVCVHLGDAANVAVNKHGDDVPCMYYGNSPVWVRNLVTTHPSFEPYFGARHCEILRWHVTPTSAKGSPQAKTKKGAFG